MGLALDGWRELVMDDSWESLVLVGRDRVNTLSGLVNQWCELGNGPALVLDLHGDVAGGLASTVNRVEVENLADWWELTVSLDSAVVREKQDGVRSVLEAVRSRAQRWSVRMDARLSELAARVYTTGCLEDREVSLHGRELVDVLAREVGRLEADPLWEIDMRGIAEVSSPGGVGTSDGTTLDELKQCLRAGEAQCLTLGTSARQSGWLYGGVLATWWVDTMRASDWERGLLVIDGLERYAGGYDLGVFRMGGPVVLGLGSTPASSSVTSELLEGEWNWAFSGLPEWLPEEIRFGRDDELMERASEGTSVFEDTLGNRSLVRLVGADGTVDMTRFGF